MSGAVMSQSLSVLLEIENDAELIELCCPTTGLPIWPFIRVPMIRTIMSDWLFNSIPLSSQRINFNYIKFAKNAVISSIHDLGCVLPSKRSVLIQSTGLGNYKRDGLIYDRLVGYFAEVLPKATLVYQDKPKEGVWSKYAFNYVQHKTSRNIINGLCSKLLINNDHKKLARSVVGRAAENAFARLGYEFSADRILNLNRSLAGHLAALPYMSDIYANWFSKQGFKLLLKEDACYGGGGISIIHAAKVNNMIVAEYQHGAISKGHDAYNVAEKLANYESFKKVLPDYLLTYGRWWSGQTNMPVKKLAIGNPHLTEAVGRSTKTSDKKNQILILGDGIETDLYINLAASVMNMVDGQGVTVVFRPHPFEREKVKSYALPNGLQLDAHADIYPSLKESRIVISELSTGLFEAVGLVDKVLLWETDKSRFTFPEIPFASFATMDELKSLLVTPASELNNFKIISSHELWEPNWKQNYLHFISGRVAQ